MISLNPAILQWLRHVCIAATLVTEKQHRIKFICSMFHALMTYVTRTCWWFLNNETNYTHILKRICWSFLEILTPYQLKYILLVQHKYTVRKWCIALLHQATWRLLHTLSKYTPPPSSIRDRGDEAGGSRLLYNRCTNEDPQISGATIQNLLPRWPHAWNLRTPALKCRPSHHLLIIIWHNPEYQNFKFHHRKNFNFNLST